MAECWCFVELRVYLVLYVIILELEQNAVESMNQYICPVGIPRTSGEQTRHNDIRYTSTSVLAHLFSFLSSYHFNLHSFEYYILERWRAG